MLSGYLGNNCVNNEKETKLPICKCVISEIWWFSSEKSLLTAYQEAYASSRHSEEITEKALVTWYHSWESEVQKGDVHFPWLWGDVAIDPGVKCRWLHCRSFQNEIHCLGCVLSVHFAFWFSPLVIIFFLFLVLFTKEHICSISYVRVLRNSIYV